MGWTEERRRPIIEALGYHYVPEYEVEMPERLYFHKHPVQG